MFPVTGTGNGQKHQNPPKVPIWLLWMCLWVRNKNPTAQQIIRKTLS